MEDSDVGPSLGCNGEKNYGDHFLADPFLHEGFRD